MLARACCKDCRGDVVGALCRVLPGKFSVVETEALAVEVGVMLAKELDIQKIIVESDSLSVVQSIAAKDLRGESGHIFQGICCFLEGFSSWQIRHLKRGYNRVAHELARYAKCNGISQVWSGMSPPVVKILIHMDCL
ncbi:uncharacterized protein LOC142623382 [Castanea sativa]|uniref:uncharacterized protein LOC142623382 n=1 Tax=Castanea sativa TaxID=21020 RepID=UPI003F64BD6D